jgi:hypothetical protein
MTRPLKPVPRPTAEEEQRERRFTKRLLWLALASGIVGGVVQVGFRSMGKHPVPRPAGAIPAPQLPPTDDNSGK